MSVIERLEAEIARAEQSLRNTPVGLPCGEADAVTDRIADLRDELEKLKGGPS